MHDRKSRDIYVYAFRRHDERAGGILTPGELQVRNTFWCSTLAAPSCRASPSHVHQFGSYP